MSTRPGALSLKEKREDAFKFNQHYEDQKIFDELDFLN